MLKRARGPFLPTVGSPHIIFTKQLMYVGYTPVSNGVTWLFDAGVNNYNGHH